MPVYLSKGRRYLNDYQMWEMTDDLFGPPKPDNHWWQNLPQTDINREAPCLALTNDWCYHHSFWNVKLDLSGYTPVHDPDAFIEGEGYKTGDGRGFSLNGPIRLMSRAVEAGELNLVLDTPGGGTSVLDETFGDRRKPKGFPAPSNSLPMDTEDVCLDFGACSWKEEGPDGQRLIVTERMDLLMGGHRISVPDGVPVVLFYVPASCRWGFTPEQSFNHERLGGEAMEFYANPMAWDILQYARMREQTKAPIFGIFDDAIRDAFFLVTDPGDEFQPEDFDRTYLNEYYRFWIRGNHQGFVDHTMRKLNENIQFYTKVASGYLGRAAGGFQPGKELTYGSVDGKSGEAAGGAGETES